MSNYNTETVNVQFLNQAFWDKIDQGLTKKDQGLKEVRSALKIERRGGHRESISRGCKC